MYREVGVWVIEGFFKGLIRLLRHAAVMNSRVTELGSFRSQSVYSVG